MPRGALCFRGGGGILQNLQNAPPRQNASHATVFNKGILIKNCSVIGSIFYCPC